MSKSNLNYLTAEQLNKLSTPRLLNVLKSARAVHSAIGHYRGPRCCELCHEYIGSDWENDVEVPRRPVKEYMDKIKAVLATREHVG